MAFKIPPHQNILYTCLLNPNILQLTNSSACSTCDWSSVKYAGIFGKKECIAILTAVYSLVWSFLHVSWKQTSRSIKHKKTLESHFTNSNVKVEREGPHRQEEYTASQFTQDQLFHLYEGWEIQCFYSHACINQAYK